MESINLASAICVVCGQPIMPAELKPGTWIRTITTWSGGELRAYHLDCSPIADEPSPPDANEYPFLPDGF